MRIVRKDIICTVSAAVIVLAGVASVITGFAVSNAVQEDWVKHPPNEHPKDDKFRLIGYLDRGGHANGDIYYKYDPHTDIHTVSATAKAYANGSLTTRDYGNTGQRNGIHIDYSWRVDSQLIVTLLEEDGNQLHHDLDQGFADAFSARSDLNGKEGYFCGGATLSGKKHEGMQGAFFVTTANSYPYQPGQQSSVVDRCHQGV